MQSGSSYRHKGLGEHPAATQPPKPDLLQLVSLYRDRNPVERFFNRIKHCRRVATRYDKRTANFLAFVKLAAIRLWLSAYESTGLAHCHRNQFSEWRGVGEERYDNCNVITF